MAPIIRTRGSEFRVQDALYNNSNCRSQSRGLSWRCLCAAGDLSIEIACQINLEYLTTWKGAQIGYLDFGGVLQE